MVTKLEFPKTKTPSSLQTSLRAIGESHSLRCDAKQAEPRFAHFKKFISSVESFCLGDCLPQPFIKGSQPNYLESLEPTGVPVISTIAIQNRRIIVDACRYISQEDYDHIENIRKPKKNDVLLTLDGGTSIGKPALFNLEDDFAIDSHVAILRPDGLDPKLLVYLLASPLGQVQFNRAESGASGQTAVTEEDVRRFQFPLIKGNSVQQIIRSFEKTGERIADLEREIKTAEEDSWNLFRVALLSNGR